MGWALIYTGVSVFLNVQSATLAGDFNSDGKVDAADYVAWRTTSGSLADYNTWRAHFGQATPGSSASLSDTTAPEPATLALLILAAAGLYSQRRPTEPPFSKLVNA